MASRTARCAVILMVVLAWAGSALAADPQKQAPPDASPEMRREMAAVHHKMAACLESEQPIAACRAEMMKSCQTMMGESGCPMMGMGPGMMGGGMKHGPGMMQGPASKEEPDK